LPLDFDTKPPRNIAMMVVRLPFISYYKTATRGEVHMLSVNCETRKTKLSVPDFGDYMLLKKDR
jgi:hypothetical protein